MMMHCRNFFRGKKLAKLEQKLRNAEKCEDTEATKARSGIAAGTVLSSTATTIMGDSNAVGSPLSDKANIPLVSSEAK